MEDLDTSESGDAGLDSVEDLDARDCGYIDWGSVGSVEGLDAKESGDNKHLPSMNVQDWNYYYNVACPLLNTPEIRSWLRKARILDGNGEREVAGDERREGLNEI